MNAPFNISEEEIVKGCIKGKRYYQEALYNQYCNKLMGICRRYIKDTMEAEDVFQEALIKIFKGIKQYKGGSFEGWMKKITVNTAITHYHKSKKHQYHEDIVDFKEDYADYNNIIEQLSDEELLGYIDKLPDGYKMVLNMYVIEGYSHKEIADMLQISVGTSKSQLFKAKAMLKNFLINDNYIQVANGY